MKWESVIGLEVHTQLLTASKIFSGASAMYGSEPNTQACAVDIALPGVLPVMNVEAARMAVKLGLVIGAEINRHSVFARKNYFYPDLPKGYQISQYELPIVKNGYIDIEVNGTKKKIGITRAHLEEDAGKSLHEDFHGLSGIDLNRAGTPLLEIVSEPDMRSAAEAVAYLKKLHELVRYLEICDGNMQEGSFRCDANVSVRPKGQETFGTRAELKNINSFKFIEKAIEFEIERQIDVLESGGEVVQETRLYDPDKGETRPLRGKEEAHDYRYFPDPDLPPLELDEAFIEAVRQTLPELPDAKRARIKRDYKLSDYDAGVLTATAKMADYYERAVKESKSDPKLVANWIIGDLSAYLNKENLSIEHSAVSATKFAGLMKNIDDGTLSVKTGKQALELLWKGEGADVTDESAAAESVIVKFDLAQIGDTTKLEQVIDKVLAASGAQVQQYRSGQEKVFGYFVGQVMKATGGKANPKQVNEILKKKLNG
ncbi:MAG: Asp-tRNA(Asn)/Glu-tRNA(Gln) amidotransferase subunit GatB [Gammaproteobacteria bacterium]|nr:Asp-tRNA(Asn)/Glu-tRNA(Gln) amidotransferase subunit GatB [Gammaproteobacteria bacterium]